MTASEILSKVKLGFDRRQVIEALGQPTDTSLVNPKKRRQPGIYKYGDIELHFSPGRHGVLWLVYSEDEKGEPTTHAKT